MRTLFAKTLALGCVLMALGLRVATAEDLSVLKGSSSRVPVPEGVKKINVSNPALIDARPADDGRSVLVIGLTEGSGDLRIERLQGADLMFKVTVRADLQGMLDQLKELLSDVEGVEIKQIGDKIALKGTVVTKSGYDKVEKVVGAFGGGILNLINFDPKELSKYYEDAIVRDIGIEGIKARVVKDTVILEGVVYNGIDATNAAVRAKVRMPNVVNLIVVKEVMIETDIQFIQVSADNSESFGKNVLKSTSGSGGIGTGGGGGFSVAGMASINAVVGTGAGKILVNQSLTTKSGGEGHFQSGGTTFFPVSGGTGAGTLEKVDYGVLLKVKPTLQGRDRVMNEVTIEVSVPVAKGAGAFSLDRFVTTSTVMCKVGESVVLSGFVQQLQNRFKEKTPLLGDIPLLSLFFAEKGGNTSKKELMVVMTPHPVFPDAATGPAFNEERKKLLQDQDAKDINKDVKDLKEPKKKK